MEEQTGPGLQYRTFQPSFDFCNQEENNTDMTMRRKTHVWPFIAGVLLAAAIFVVDVLVLPSGVAGGVPYVAVVLVALWLPRQQHVLYAAIGVSALNILGYLWSDPAGLPWMVLANRLLALFVIWVTATVGYLRRQTEATTHMRDREARLSAVVDTAVDAIITIDERGTVEAVNHAGCQLFGYGTDDIIGQNVRMLMPHPYHDEHDGYLANYLRSGERKIIGIGREVTGLRKDRTTFPMHLAVSEVTLQDRRLFTGIVRDISELKRVEQELRQLNEELEDRVRQRTSELKDAQDALVRKEKLAVLGQLAGGIAHEIRNPLGIIKNAVYFLEQTSPQSDEDTQDAFAELGRSLTTCDRIIGELLDYTRGPELKMSLFTLDEAIDRSMNLARIPDSVQVERLRGQGDMCRGDRDQIERILLNLIQNAVQAMPDGGTLTLDGSQEDDRIVISVGDTGVGIAAENLDNVFEPLFTRKAKGIGLGLAVSKRYAEINHGRLDVESEPGKGTTFRLTLPSPDAETS